MSKQENQGLSGSAFTAYTCLDRALVLARCGKEDPTIVPRVNALLRSRTGRFALRVEHNLKDGLTLFCRSFNDAPRIYVSIARVVKVVDGNGNVLKTINRRESNELEAVGQQPA